MATIGSLAVASDIAYAALEFYVRGKALHQNIQERPLLAWLTSNEQSFPAGKQYISEPIQGSRMGDTSGFFAGYSQDDALTFTQSANILRAQFAWKEVHAGFVITQTELKQDGISLTDGESRVSDHGDMLTRLTGILENRLADFADSWSNAMNSMYWNDGTQDSKQVPGLRALLVDDPTTGTVGGLAQSSYSWWRSRVKLDLSPSAENQTISKFFRNEVIQLQRYGGRPNKAFCGSSFWDALSQEVEKKGIYTQQGFAGRNNDIGLTKISIAGIGTFEYDPTLDSLGLSKRCYVLDSRRIKRRPMEQEANKVIKPSRPYQYMVMLQSMTDTSALSITQLSGCGVYGIS